MRLLFAPEAKALTELDAREVARADAVVIDRNLIVKNRNEGRANRRLDDIELARLRRTARES